MKTDPQNENSPEEWRSGTLIQLHIAEYNALTTRASYWMVMQFSLLAAGPAMGVLAYYLYQVTGSMRTKVLILWMTLAVLQLVAMLWANMMLEQFALVKYIECYLAPQIRKTIASESFWLYETYLLKNRPLNPALGNYSMAGAALAAIAILFLVRVAEFSRWDAVGSTTNILLLTVLCVLSHQIGRIQRDWAKCDKLLIQQLGIE